jgi:hypothetical protein
VDIDTAHECLMLTLAKASNALQGRRNKPARGLFWLGFRAFFPRPFPKLIVPEERRLHGRFFAS